MKLKLFPAIDRDWLEKLRQDAEEKTAIICREVSSLEATISEYTRAKRLAAERQNRRKTDKGAA